VVTLFDCAEATTLTQPQQIQELKKLQSAYQSTNTLEAKFEQDSFVASLELSEVSSGQVYLRKPGRMRWHYQLPEEQDFIVRDETLWLYQPEQRQVTIDQFKRNLISDLPVAFLMGLGDLSSNFDVITGCRSGNRIVLELKSKSKKNSGNDLASLTLAVGDADESIRTLRGAKIIDSSGNSTAIALIDLRSGAVLGEDRFSILFPEGVDIIDRRQQSQESPPNKEGRE